MHLYVEPMDAVVVEVAADGRVRFEHEGERWSSPTLQECRAIIYSATNQIAELTELIEVIEKTFR